MSGGSLDLYRRQAFQGIPERSLQLRLIPHILCVLADSIYDKKTKSQVFEAVKRHVTSVVDFKTERTVSLYDMHKTPAVAERWTKVKDSETQDQFEDEVNRLVSLSNCTVAAMIISTDLTHVIFAGNQSGEGYFMIDIAQGIYYDCSDPSFSIVNHFQGDPSFDWENADTFTFSLLPKASKPAKKEKKTAAKGKKRKASETKSKEVAKEEPKEDPKKKVKKELAKKEEKEEEEKEPAKKKAKKEAEDDDLFAVPETTPKKRTRKTRSKK